MAELDDVLTDDVLLEAFGGGTIGRALAYADTKTQAIHRLELTELDRDGFDARALVVGSRATPYHVELHCDLFDLDGFDEVELSSSCSCPVGVQCKHGAALALRVRAGAATRRPPSWSAQLAGVIDELDRGSDQGSASLALEVSLDLPDPRRPYAGAGDPRIRLRPLREGARQKWVRGGARWVDLATASTVPGPGQLGHDRRQLAALQALHAAVTPRYGFYHSGLETLTIGDLGPRVWALLRAAREAGVAFVPVAALGELTLVDELHVVADLAGGSEQGAIDLWMTVEHDGAWWSGEQVVPIGVPAHGAILLTPRRPGIPAGSRLAAPAGASYDVVLGAFDTELPAASIRLLRSDEPLRIPAADRDAFVDDYLPRLQRQLRARSSDGTVEIPDLPAPRLLLEVTWRSALHAELSWAWRYGAGPSAPRTPVGSADRLGGLRDHAGERDLLARLDEVLVDTAPDPDHARRLLPGGPAAARTVRGESVLDLAETFLPAVRGSDLVTVVEQDAPDFREADGAPEISFDAVPAEGEPEDDARTDWLDLQVTITVDGEAVPLVAVLTALSTGQSRVILPSGLHLAADRPEFAALQDLLAAASELREVDGDRIGVGAHDLGLWAQLAELGIVDAQADEWVRRAQALRDLVDLPEPDPVGVVSTLRHYQRDGFHWLAFLWRYGLGGILADDMGLGKTLQVLALVSHARAEGAAPFLVVAPTSVVTAWRAEAERHTPDLVVRTVTASAARRVDSLRDLAEGVDVVVTTYTLLRLEQEQYAALTWGGLVLDEAQQVKNHQGKTYAAVRGIEAPFRLAVTGTPFENRLMELWSLLSITAPGLYPWPKAFTQHVVHPVEKRGDERALHRFRQRIRPFVLRRTKELVAADLPAKQEQVLEVPLGAKHRRIYDTHLQRERQKVLGLVGDFERNRVAIFSALTRLRQLALAPGLLDDDHAAIGSAKLDTLVEHLHEIVSEGHRVLVFSQFTRYLTLARRRLEAEGIETAYLDGRTKRRGEVVEGFRSGQAPVFLISLKAGGVGLTLTEADYVFVLDPWWNPATEAQAVDRVHRIGQQRPVMVYRLVAADTIEDKVMEMKARKAALFAQVVEGDGGLGSGIDADDIRGLFA